MVPCSPDGLDASIDRLILLLFLCNSVDCLVGGWVDGGASGDDGYWLEDLPGGGGGTFRPGAVDECGSASVSPSDVATVVVSTEEGCGGNVGGARGAM